VTENELRNVVKE